MFPGENTQRLLQKRHLISVLALLQTLSRLFHLVQFFKCYQISLKLNSKGYIEVQEKKKKVAVLCFRSSEDGTKGLVTWTLGRPQVGEVTRLSI